MWLNAEMKPDANGVVEPRLIKTRTKSFSNINLFHVEDDELLRMKLKKLQK